MTPAEHALLTDLIADQQASAARDAEHELVIDWWRHTSRARHEPTSRGGKALRRAGRRGA